MKKNENLSEKIKEILKKSWPLVGFFLLMLLLTILLWDKINALATEEGRERFKLFVGELGFGGWLITLGIQLLQIFIAFIPGEPVELMLGYVWGPWLGTFTCLLGVFIGTTFIYTLVKKLGMPFVIRMVGTDDLKKYKFLSNEKRVELTLFILFFISGTPKDALTYIAPIAPIKPIKFLLIATFARIPSIITSTILGNSIAEEKYFISVIVFVFTAIVSVAGMFYGEKFLKTKK